MTAAASAVKRTATEALHAKLQTNDYFKDVYKNNDTCSAHLVNSTGVIYNVAKRTGTEAIHAKLQVNKYITDCSRITAKCSTLLDSIDLPRPQNVPNCTYEARMVNVSINLQYLLHMYSHVLGLVYQNSSADTDQLDLLEMTYYRLFSQIQRYLQVHNLSSGNDYVPFTSSEEPRLERTQNVKVVLCHLREMAIRALDIIIEEIGNITLYGYKFCHSVTHVNCGS